MKRRPPLWLTLAALLGLAALVLFFVREPSAPPASPLARAKVDAVALPERTAAQLPDADDSAAAAPHAEPAPEALHGELSGRVISSDRREPIAGAEVTWSSPRGAAHSARTDGLGRFTFAPPEAGEYQLASAKADGFLPFGPAWGRSPLTVVFRSGERVRGVTVELTPAPEHLARVIDASGKPVPGATARVLVPRKDETALFPMRERFTTDARGEFTFRAEPFSSLEAWHDRLGSGSARCEPQMSEVVIALEPWPPDAGARVALSGRVVTAGRGVPGALVHVASALSAYPLQLGAQDGYRELTDDDGRFEVTELQPGIYDVSAHLLGTAPAHRFDVRAPASNVLLELGSGGRVKGRVTDEHGAAVPSFVVTLEWRKAALEKLTVVEAGFVEPDGRYTIDGVAPGVYALEVTSVGFTEASTQALVPESGDATADVTLEHGARISGTVRTEVTRAPIAQARVALERGEPVALTDASGAFTLDGLSPRGFSLQASAAGHNTRVITVADASASVDIELSAIAPDAGPKTELVGIGAVLRGRGDALVIGAVMPGGGASSAGLQAGDEIVSVDQHAVAELGFEPSIRAIRGPVASPVELQVRRGGAPMAQSVTVTRMKISN